MDYKRETVQYLRQYDLLNVAVENLHNEIQELKIDLKNVSAIKYDDGSGSTNGTPDDKVVNKMVRLEHARSQYVKTKRTLKRINTAFEKFGTHRPFYSNVLKKLYIENLSEEQVAKDMHYSPRQFRRIKHEAISHFGVIIFGVDAI